jgi:hypothetical protein
MWGESDSRTPPVAATGEATDIARGSTAASVLDVRDAPGNCTQALPLPREQSVVFDATGILA